MAVINITVNTNVSALTPPGGNTADDYYVSNGASLTVNQNFTFRTLTLGKNSSGTASTGYLNCQFGFTCTSNLATPEAADIEIWNLGEVRDDAVTPTTRDSVIKFLDASTSPNPVIKLRESGAKWSVGYYLLIKPAILFQVYEDLSSTPFSSIPISTRVDVVRFSENEGGKRFELQNRFGKRPRFFPLGDEGRNVVMGIGFDTEAGLEVGLWQQFLTVRGLKGCLITDRRVWPNIRVVTVGQIERAWGSDTTTARPAIQFVEDV